MLQRGLAILLSVCMLTGGISDTVYAKSAQSDVWTVSAAQNVSDTGEISALLTEDATGDAAGSEASDDNNIEVGDETTGDAADTEDNTPGDSADSESDADQSGTEDEEGSDSDAAVIEDEAVAEDRSESGTDDAVDESEATVSVQSIKEEELTVMKNAEGNYTLRSDSYRLKLVMTPSYRLVKTALELRQANGTALTGSGEYKVYYKYSYDDYWGGKSNSDVTIYLTSPEYKGATETSSMAAGGALLITELQIRDSSDNILAVLGAGGQAISVSTSATERQGVLTQVTAEDTSITVKSEMMSNNNGRLRYRKKEETEWSYYKSIISYYYASTINLAAEPDTDYVVELTATDMETVYDTAEIRTKAFAASDNKAEVTNITSSEATIKVTVGAYTGNNRYICARVSYTDNTGDLQTREAYQYVSDIAKGSIDLSLRNLTAGTEYKDLEVELDDTDFTSMEYAAYRTKVSFQTVASALTAEQIKVTANPDAEDVTKAVLKVALQGVSEGSYPYKVQCHVKGSKDWPGSLSKSGTLDATNNYAGEQNLTSLVGGTEYEVQVMVDGIYKRISFTTASAAISASVEVKPLMQGVQVKAALKSAQAIRGIYDVAVQYYDQNTCRWDTASYTNLDDTRLTGNNNWESTAVFYSESIKLNAENDWKVLISCAGSKVYEKYFTLKAVSQKISLKAEGITYTTAQIRALLTARDESMQRNRVDLYYREKGAARWILSSTYTYISENGSTVYLDGLKEDTEYEVKLVSNPYPEDILAQTTFRTLKDTRSLSVLVDNCRYTSAQVNWAFDAGANVLDRTYICIYYREKDDKTWTFLGGMWRISSYALKETLTALKEGTSYEVLAEMKDKSSDTVGEDVIRDAETEFTTAAKDHELKAELVENETEATSVTYDMQLTKASGGLENREKVVVTLEPAAGSKQSKIVYLNKENQYKAKVKVSGLFPNTTYTVNAELYESENNVWTSLQDFDLGTVTTAEVKAPTALTISETEVVLNKGSSKKLTVTVEPLEAAIGLAWASSDGAVAAISSDGTVTARKAGEADITVSAASASDSGTEFAVSHVTVRDYVIRAKNDESYNTVPSLLSKAQKRTLVVYDNTEERELTGVTWSSSNPNTAKISEDGLLEPQNYGQAYIMANTEDGIMLKALIKVVNEIQGFSITRPENDNDAYRAIRTAEAVYQVVAGETYRVGCVLSPAYTNNTDSSVSVAGDRFTWSTDNDAVTFKVPGGGNSLTEISIPESVSGPVIVSAVMKDEEYKDKSFSITLDVLKKPEMETLPATYTWLDYSNKLKDVILPENWKWTEQSTLIYEAGTKTFTARYAQSGYYPYETEVTVYAGKIGNDLSVIGDYNKAKKAYIVKKETPLKVSVNAPEESIPSLLYEQSALAPAAKEVAKVSISTPDEEGYYSVTASAKGTYTVSTTVSLKKAAFEKQDGAYVLTAGDVVKNMTTSVKFMAVDSSPIQNITFAVAEDSPEKVTFTEDGTIEYEITAANADTKNNQRVIHLDVTAKDTDGNKVENPNINYAVSNTAVVKQKKQGTSRLVLTIPKGADGLAKIVATAKDELGYSTEFAVRVKDHTPRVTTNRVTVNENYTKGTQIAQVLLPYWEDGNDQIKVLLVETNSKEKMKEVAGLRVSSQGYDKYKFQIYLYVSDLNKITRKGNLKYYLAVTTKTYGETVFVPVQIKIEKGMPAISLRQTGKVNVFYTDTTNVGGYDTVSMGLVELTSKAAIESVRWVAGEDSGSVTNTEFVIKNEYSSVSRNGKYTKKYMIQQHKPILDSKKKPSKAAAKGYIGVCLSGYNKEIKMPLTIQTVYKKPKLKVADYIVCPAFGQVTHYQYTYTNAAKTNNNLIKGSTPVWRAYSDVLCTDDEIEVIENSSVGLRYSGTNDKKAQLKFYSDYWYEPLTVPVKVKAANSKVKLSPATVTLNTAYPSEVRQTVASTSVCNAGTGTNKAMSDVKIEGANVRAQQILDQSLINIAHNGTRLNISLNYAKAMGDDQIKPGSYKFKLTPYLEDTELNSVMLTVKIINKAATVQVKAKGTIDLLKLSKDTGSSYNVYSDDSVMVTPTFKNLDSSYTVTDVKLEGAYKDLFKTDRVTGGRLAIVPNSVGTLKAGKSYHLSVTYTVRDTYSAGGEMITLTSNTFTIKPKQSVPKITASAKQLSLYTCAKGESKAEKMYLYVPFDSKKGYYVIEDASGSLDVNKDGKADLMVKTLSIDKFLGRAQMAVYVLDADAVKATAKGVMYKIPVTVKCVGRDGVSKDASTTVRVIVKK